MGEKTLLRFTIFLFSIFLLFVFGITFVQGVEHTLEDYGLSEESVKYLSPQEIEDILNSKTPEETRAALRAQIEEFGTPEQKENIDIIFPDPRPASLGLLENTVDCFDYYSFGSVQTNITAQSFYVDSGTDMNFDGTIINQNDYPIIDGTLYVKILRDRSALKDPNGPDVIDQFVAVENIIIPAKGEIPVSFTWKVPVSLIGGDYKIASFFIVAKKFNLLGLSFTDDVIGNTFNFEVNGEKSNVQFNKAGVEINNSPYFFAASPPRIPSGEPAVISARIDNSTNSNETVDIVWKLYKWDSINPANLIRTVSEESTIKAKSSKEIQFVVSEADDPVYYLVGELIYKDSKSIVGIRFVRPEVDKTRLNFPSIMNFPIKKGITSTMFSCVHNSGISQSVPNGKLTLKILNDNGATIDEYTYQGEITGEMMGVKKDFISKNNLDHFFLTAQLWQADKLVDETTLEYDCNKIDPKLCKSKNNLIVLIAFGIIILIAICIAVISFIKRKNKI